VAAALVQGRALIAAQLYCEAADVLLVLLLLVLIPVIVRRQLDSSSRRQQLLLLCCGSCNSTADQAAAVVVVTELVQTAVLPAAAAAQSNCAHYSSSIMLVLPLTSHCTVVSTTVTAAGKTNTSMLTFITCAVLDCTLSVLLVSSCSSVVRQQFLHQRSY
jgi:Na+-driven multidrug efflux pump